jgi:ADP-heptose:LPS heptosyltransferase
VGAEIAAANAGRETPIRLFPSAEIDDFEELAGLAANLDAVVSVQTALVHLCGALGKTCLTLVPQTAEWRYGARGTTMPWYNSVRLFRQAEHGVWDSVIADAAGALARF